MRGVEAGRESTLMIGRGCELSSYHGERCAGDLAVPKTNRARARARSPFAVAVIVRHQGKPLFPTIIFSSVGSETRCIYNMRFFTLCSPLKLMTRIHITNMYNYSRDAVTSLAISII